MHKIYKSQALRVFLPFALALAIASFMQQATQLSKALKKSLLALIPFSLALTADFTINANFYTSI
jgi:hypothetical protein